MLLLASGIGTDVCLVLAARGRGLAKLLEGDPVAWSILAGCVVIFGGIAIYKKMNGGGD